MKQELTPCLWFDNNAEEAVNFYASVFKNSSIGEVTRYGKEGFEIHKMPEGTVLTINFELNGLGFTALNAGPVFKFNEAVSFQISCKDQPELDHYWERLSGEGGEPGQCGWLKDKFGLSWQVVPEVISNLLQDPSRSERVMKALMKMKKLDIKELEEA